jgi:hypothetical protein
VQSIKHLQKARLCVASLYSFAGEGQEGEVEAARKEVLYSAMILP